MTPAWLQQSRQRVGHLSRHPLLDLRPLGEDVDEPGQLGQPGDPAVGRGDVADVRDAVEGHQVVLAGAVDLDVLDQHHLVVAEVEGRGEHVLGVLPQAGEHLGVRPSDPGRRLARGRRGRGSSPMASEQLAHGRLGAPWSKGGRERAVVADRDRVDHRHVHSVVVDRDVDGAVAGGALRDGAAWRWSR